MVDENTTPPLSEAVSQATEKITGQINKHPRHKLLLIAGGGGLLVLVILLLSIAACNKKDQVASPEALSQHNSDTLGFTLSHPDTWTVTETDAPSGPDIVIADQAGPAFVRIRGFLDVNLTSVETVRSSMDQYREMLSLQPGVRINDIQINDTGDSVTEFIMTGEFPVADVTYSFEERGMLTTTGRVLLMRAADLPDRTGTSLPVMRSIIDSFSLEQPTGAAWLDAPDAFAADPPLASMGNATYNITDYQGNPVDITDSRDGMYLSSLRGNLINAGVRLNTTGEAREEIMRLREENNQLNQGRGGRTLMTDANGDTFFGYKKYSTDLPEPTYRIDTRINVRHRDENGDNQDIIVSLRIYNSQTGQLVGTTSVEQENTPRYIDKQYVGGKPTWVEKYVTGYAKEMTYEDSLRTLISEAASDVTGKLSALSNQELESDAARFARSLKESGYIPLVPDEQAGQSLDDDSERDPNCPYFYATGTIDGPRTCFQTQAQLNAALGVDDAGNPLPLPDPADYMRENSTAPDNNSNASNNTTDQSYVDPRYAEFIQYLESQGNTEARAHFLQQRAQAYLENPVPGYGSAEEYASASNQALNNAISDVAASPPETGTDEVGTYEFDSSSPGTYQGPGSYTTESR